MLSEWEGGFGYQPQIISDLQLQFDKQGLLISTKKSTNKTVIKAAQKTGRALVTENKTKYLKILLNFQDLWIIRPIELIYYVVPNVQKQYMEVEQWTMRS